MTITIPDSLAHDAGLDEKTATLELALSLYNQEKISGSQVRRLCGLGYFDFLKVVEARGLPSCVFTDQEGRREIENLKKLGWL